MKTLNFFTLRELVARTLGEYSKYINMRYFITLFYRVLSTAFKKNLVSQIINYIYIYDISSRMNSIKVI